MKKRVLCILLCLCVALTMFPAAAFAATGNATVDSIVSALNGVTLTKDTTGVQLMEVARNAAKAAGAAGVVQEGNIIHRVASATKNGTFIINLIVYMPDGQEVRYKFSKTYSLNGGGSGSGSGSGETAASTQLAAAKKAVTAAFKALPVSNDTTAEEVMAAAKASLPAGSKVTITWISTGFYLRKADATRTGEVKSNMLLTCDSLTDKALLSKTISKVMEGDAALLDADKTAMRTAISAMTVSNNTTIEEVLQAAQAAATHGTKAALGSDFKKTPATFAKKGSFYGTIVLTLGSETRNMELIEYIPMLVRELPRNQLSVTKSEWEILRIVNAERAEEGLSSLTMPAALQKACNTRERELYTKYSHTRPNGKDCITAISKSFKYKRSAENICKGTTLTPATAMEKWMKSKAHRANILNSKLGYIGIGASKGRWVQLFTNRDEIVSFSTSAGTFDFADEEAMMKEYLICVSAGGVKSFMPLDVDSLEKVEGGYSPRISGENVPVLTVGKVTAPSTDAERIASDKARMVELIKSTSFTNSTTKAGMLKVIMSAAKYDTKGVWSTDYSKKSATSSKSGYIKGTVKLTLGSETLTIKINKGISK